MVTGVRGKRVGVEVAEIDAAGHTTFRTKHKTADGEIRDVLVIARPVSLSGGRAMLAIWHDMTEQEEIRRALGQKDAALREILGKFISSAVFCLGYLWIAIDKEKRGWHDSIASTHVVKVEPGK